MRTFAKIVKLVFLIPLGAIASLLALLILLFLISSSINNISAAAIEKQLVTLPLPPSTEMREKVSAAGKLNGNGNGMQFFGAILIETELSLETLYSDKPFVFVVPTYAWRMPRIVEQWILKTALTGSKSAYFVLTCGAECGNATPYAKALCKEKGLEFCGLADIVMPENYLALFPTPNKAEAEQILTASAPKIATLAVCIKAGTPLPTSNPSLTDRIKSGPLNPLFYATTVSDKGFAVGDTCIDCGSCAKRCPLLNITMEKNSPQWNGNCTHCMACIGGCPTEAIEYKNKSIGRPHYYIMEDGE